MAGSLNFAAPTAHEYFAALVADDASLSLLETAIAVAQDDEPRLDPQGVLEQVDVLADKLRRRIPADAAPLQRLRLLNTYFFHELGFAGNVNDYYDRRNSYVSEVLKTRRGIPVTLAVLYIEIAQQVGLHAAGVSFPGHFLVKLQMPRGEVVIDPFSGHSLSRQDLEERLSPFRLRNGLAADDAVPIGPYLKAAAGRDVIARLLRNLKEIHRSAGDRLRLVGVMHRLVILLPRAWEERRDRAQVLADLGRLAEAIVDLTSYLEHRPDADDAPRLRRQLATWQQRPAARRH